MNKQAWRGLLRFILEPAKLTKSQIKDLEQVVAQWYATHWRDDDHPKSEYRAAREVRYGQEA